MQGQEDNCRCFVSFGYQPKEVGNTDTEFDLRTAFSQYGTIKNIDYFDNKPMAFVEFTNKEAAAFAIYNLNGSFHQGRKLKVNWAKERKEGENDRNKEGGEKEETKEKKTEEKKVTVIERPETPIGGMRVDTDVQPKKKEKSSEKQKTSR